MLYQKEDQGLASTKHTSPETGIYSWAKCSKGPFQTIRGKGKFIIINEAKAVLKISHKQPVNDQSMAD
jgi:hypothetical protein